MRSFQIRRTKTAVVTNTTPTARSYCQAHRPLAVLRPLAQDVLAVVPQRLLRCITFPAPSEQLMDLALAPPVVNTAQVPPQRLLCQNPAMLKASGPRNPLQNRSKEFKAQVRQ